MSFGNAEAFQADVVFRTNVSQFEGDQAQIRALAERTYGALDSGSLKAALASEKYDRALARSKGSAFAVAKATAAYKAELASLESAENRAAGGSVRHSSALKEEERSLAGVIRGGIAGSGVLNRFGRAAIFASTSVLGGYGLVYALRSTIGAAREQEIGIGHLEVALKNSGISWAQNKGHIDEALGSLVKLTAFTDNELTDALAVGVRRFGDVDQGLNAVAVAADVARAKGISLAEAMNLIVRASFGQSRAAKSLAIDVPAVTSHVDALRATTKNATAEQLANAKALDQQATRLKTLDAVQKSYQGSAERFARDNPQAEFNAELDRTKEIIGGALLPTFNTYLQQGSDYLDQLNKSGKLQKDVSRVMNDAEHVIHDVTGAIRVVDDVTGGFKNTLELLLALKVASTLGRWSGGLATLWKNFGRVKTAASEAAGAEGLAGAESAISTTGGGAAIAAGKVGKLRLALSGLSGLAVSPILIPIELAVSNKERDFLTKHAGILGRPGKVLLDFATGPIGDPHIFEDLGIGGHHSKSPSPKPPDNAAQVAAFRKRSRALKVSGQQLGPPIPTKGDAGTDGGGGGGDGTGGGGLPYSLQNALLEAQGTTGTADDMKVLNEQLGYLNKALAQKGLSPADRNQLLSERNDVLSQRDQITQAATEAQKQAAAAAARKQKQQFTALTHVPAVLVKRFADAEAAHKPKDVLETIRQQEIAALQRQRKTLKSDHAPESYDATIAKEIAAIQDKIDAAIRKARKARIDKLDAVPVNLRIAEANAIANNASAERLAAIYRKEKDALDKQLAQLKKIHATKQEILKNRTAAAAVEKKLTAIEKQQKADSGALARELQDAVAGLAQYAPNVTEALASVQGGPVVHNHQYFPHPPTTDGSREAIYARHALQAAFDG